MLMVKWREIGSHNLPSKVHGNAMMLKTFNKKYSIKNGIVILALIMTFSGCSLRMTYNYLDWIISWYVDDYVTFTAQQDEFFDRATIELLGWHRSAELPRYAELLTALREDLKTPMNKTEVLVYFDEITTLYQNLLQTAMPHLATLAAQLTDEQINQINQALQEQHHELQDEYGFKTPEEQRQSRKQKTTEFMDDWLGNLSKVQLQIIDGWNAQRKETTAMWLDYRKKWRIHFIEVLRTRYKDDFSLRLEQLLLNYDSLKSQDYQQASAENRLLFAQFITDISSSLNPNQRAHLGKKLSKLAADLDELSKQEG